MDMETVIICVAVFLLSALLIYLISVVTMREKTFEEVMEEQRKRQEDLLLKDHQEKKEKPKKKKKKEKVGGGGDRAEERHFPSSESDFDRKMVELELDPVIIDEELTVKPQKASPTESGKGKKRSILSNKNERVRVGRSLEAEELPHSSVVPMDSVEIKRHREQKRPDGDRETWPTRDRKKKVVEATVATETQAPPAPVVGQSEGLRERRKKEVPVEAEIAPQRVQRVANAQPPAAVTPVDADVEAVPVEPVKSSKKNKSAGAGSEASSGDVMRLASTLTTMRLGDSEIQTLVEVLLAKQTGATPEWTKKGAKGDPAVLLKRQLEDTEKLWEQEKSHAMAAGKRLQELNHELTTERQKAALIEKSSQEKENAAMQEIQALHARMQQSHEQHCSEVNALRHQAQMGDGQALLIQQLTEDNRQLKESMAQAKHLASGHEEVVKVKQQLKLMTDEMSKTALKMNTTESNNKMMESKLIAYEDKIRKLESGQRDTETLLSKKVQEVNEQLCRAEAQGAGALREKERALTQALSQAAAAKQEVASLHDKMNSAQQEVASLQGKMNNAQGAKTQSAEQLAAMEAKLRESDSGRADLAKKLEALQARLTATERTNSEKDRTLQAVQEENQGLAAELQTARQRTAGEGQEFPAQPQGQADPDALVKETAQQVLAQKTQYDVLVKQQDSELSGLKEQMEKLTAELETQRTKNNELQGAESAVTAALEALRDEKSLNEELVNQLRGEVEQLRQAASSGGDAAAARTAGLQQALDDQKEAMKALDRDLQQRDSVLEEMREQLKRAEEDKSVAASQLVSLQQEFQSKQLETQTSEHAAAQSKSELQQQAEKDAAALKALQEEAKSAAESKAKLQQQAEKDAAVLKALQEEAKSAAESKAKLQQQAEKDAAALKALQEEAQSAAESKAKLQQQAEKDAAALKSLQEEAKSAAESTAQLQQQAEKDAAALKAQQEEAKSAAESTAQLQQQTEQDAAALKALQEEMNALRLQHNAEGGAATEAGGGAATEVRDLQDRLAAKEAEVTRLSAQLESLGPRPRDPEGSDDPQGADPKDVGVAGDATPGHPCAERSLTAISLEGRVKLVPKQRMDVVESELAKKSALLVEMERQLSATSDGDSHELSESNVQLSGQLSAARDAGAGHAATDAELAGARDQLAALRQQHQELQQKAEDSERRLSDATAKLQQDLEQAEKERSSQASQLDELRRQNAELVEEKQKSESKSDDFERLKATLEVVKKENHELREGCARATETLTSAEQAAEVLAQVQVQLAALKDELQARDAQIAELQQKNAAAVETQGHAKATAPHPFSQTQTILQRSFPEIKVADTEDQETWLTSFMTAVADLRQKDASAADLEAAKLEQTKLQSQVTQYKTVLADTESMLNKLQTSVESEEQKWQTKTNQSQEDLKRAQQEILRLQEELQRNKGSSEGIANGTSSTEEVEELKAQLAKTEQMLDREIHANKQLSQKLDVSVESESSTSV